MALLTRIHLRILPCFLQVIVSPAILYVNATALRQNVTLQLARASIETISVELSAPRGWDGKPLATLLSADLKIEPSPKHEARQGSPVAGSDPCVLDDKAGSCKGILCHFWFDDARARGLALVV